MSAPVAVPLLALLVVVGLLAWFYRYSHTRAWLHSETKLALWNGFAAFGPLFGVRVPPPIPPPPAIVAMHEDPAGHL
ncbi:MAG: hypothetical protein ABR541_03945 [Candidatus Dormibacteria bacterium]